MTTQLLYIKGLFRDTNTWGKTLCSLLFPLLFSCLFHEFDLNHASSKTCTWNLLEVFSCFLLIMIESAWIRFFLMFFLKKENLNLWNLGSDGFPSCTFSCKIMTRPTVSDDHHSFRWDKQRRRLQLMVHALALTHSSCGDTRFHYPCVTQGINCHVKCLNMV